MTPRVPWLPRKRPAWTPPYGGPSETPYPTPGRPFPPGAPLWLIPEAAVLGRLADAGGDLPAHRTEHLEDL